MKNSLIAASALVLLGAGSLAHACREARTDAAPAAATCVKSTHVINLSTAPLHALAVCKTVESAAPIKVDVDVPVEAVGSQRLIHIRGVAVERPAECDGAAAVKRTARVAATLGRAFVTTVGAVFGSLVNAALDALV